VTIATAAFLAASPQIYLNGGLRLLPISWRPRARNVATEVCKTLQLWFAGQVVDMIVVAILLGSGLSFLGVKLAPTLALLAGLLNFVPYVGALAGVVPALLVALAQSPELAMWVALLFFCVQMLEGNLIAPLIQKRTISLAPALTIVSQTILGSLFGILGLVLATPLTAAIVTTVRMAYVESVLEADAKPQALASATDQVYASAGPVPDILTKT
jgi:predicted PurR-regulated permease PerM